jgi:hypothetical protein
VPDEMNVKNKDQKLNNSGSGELLVSDVQTAV